MPIVAELANDIWFTVQAEVHFTLFIIANGSTKVITTANFLAFIMDYRVEG